jgi:hypothetical protein
MPDVAIDAVPTPSDFTVTGYDGTSVTVRSPRNLGRKWYSPLPGSKLHDKRAAWKLVRCCVQCRQMHNRERRWTNEWSLRPTGFSSSFGVVWRMDDDGMHVPKLVIELDIHIACRDKRGRSTGNHFISMSVNVFGEFANLINLRRCPPVIDRPDKPRAEFADSIPDHAIVLACGALSRSLPVRLPHVVARAVGLAFAGLDEDSLWHTKLVYNKVSIDAMGVDEVVDFAQALVTAYDLNVVADCRKCVKDALGSEANEWWRTWFRA